MANEAVSRGMIKYTSRDYQSIMDDFWEIVPILTNLWTPESEADPGVVLGKILASAADMLGVNLDWLANEIYGPSVTQRKNAEKLFALCGYSLGWYKAAKTEILISNITGSTIKLDLGFNGNNFCTLNAYSDITGAARVITYNILPLTNGYGDTNSRSTRVTTADTTNVFAEADNITLEPDESVTRVAVEGELRNYSVSVEAVKNNNYIINLPSQHIDTTLVWLKAKATAGSEEFLTTQWKQVTSPSEFQEPEPRFAVTYDNYSNARIQVSNYLNEMENYSDNYLVVYWIDTTGTIGCVGKDVLQNLVFAKSQPQEIEPETDLAISNLSNTVELPHTYTVTGKSPETAKEAYYNSKNYINTFDSLVTLPDFERFLNREAGVDTGIVIDCQKALEINMAIYYDENLSDSQKSKMYITNNDFPADEDSTIDWQKVLGLGFDPTDPNKYVFAANFKTYTAMCFAIHNDFNNSDYGNGQVSTVQIKNSTKFTQYKPPIMFIDQVIADYKPLQAMTVQVDFGYVRLFDFYLVGQIIPVNPVTQEVGDNIIAKVKEALALYFAPANRHMGQKPTQKEIVEVIEGADSRIFDFDSGSSNNPLINWYECDIEYFNPISFARYIDSPYASDNIRIAPEYLIKK